MWSKTTVTRALLLALLAVALVASACGGDETTTTSQGVTTTQGVTSTSAVPTTQAVTTTTTAATATAAVVYPSQRVGHAMVYDPGSKKAILFGGVGADPGSALNDTWAYDPANDTWTELHPAGTVPPARWASAMAYDPKGHRVILFGGIGDMRDPSTYLNDTWAYDSATNAWTQLQPGGSIPSPCAPGPLVYDPSSGGMLLFGACSNVLDPSTYRNDSWVYDPAGNTWTALPSSGTLPSERNGATANYDPTGGKSILFGGGGFGFNLGDTWAYDSIANAWTQLRPGGTAPSARWAQAMAYDPINANVIMFGGCHDVGDPNGFFNDTWAYDPVANAWTDREPAGNLPLARNGTAMVFDPVSGLAILFGGQTLGQDGQFRVLGDVWAYDPAANTWTERASATKGTAVASSTTSTTAPGAAKTYKDLVYATSTPDEKLDLYLPSSGDGPFPLIVWIHGGAFVGGDKALDNDPEAAVLGGLLRGYAVASVNYRLLGTGMFPAAVQDVKAAVRYLRANATKYNLDPDRIAAWGGSAGGYFAAMLGTSGGVSSLDDPSLGNPQQSSAVQAVVDWFGAIVVDPAFEAEPINPTIHISADDPPFLIEHGTADEQMPLEQSTNFAAALTRVLGEKKVTLKLLEGAGHNDPQFYTSENLSYVFDWLDGVLK